MSSKNFIFLLVLISLVPILIGVDQLSASLFGENILQASQGYTISGHADTNSNSFNNWNDNDPPLIPANCAKCHSTTGFLDFLGEGSSTFGEVEQDIRIGEVITCLACHNPSADGLAQVPFHSAVEMQAQSSEAVCLACHQSRQSTPGIQSVLVGLPEDQVSTELSFINPHYNFAASTQFGSAARSGYEYPERIYAGYFDHAANASTCSDCHNAHSLQVDPQKCAVCHVQIVSVADFKSIRMGTVDYDGNADTSEGIYYEINALTQRLFQAIQHYANEIGGLPVIYADQFPYFFIDTNQDGSANPDEIQFSNRYNAWTPRLVKAAYNYQFAKKDGGGYVHNPLYMIQLLHDSLADLELSLSSEKIELPRP